MAEPSKRDDLAVALAQLEQRARTRMRRRLPLAVLVGGAVAFGSSQWGPSSGSGHHHHGSVARGLILLVIWLVVIAGVGLVLWRTRKRWEPFSYWKRPLPIAGLDRRDRRAVRRDLKRGTPSADPLLRAVEMSTVARLRKMQPTWTLWIMPVVAAVTAANAALPGRSTSSRACFLVLAVLFLIVGAFALRQRRGINRFPDETPA